MKKSQTSSKLLPFGSSIFGEMTKLAGEHNAINLSQGFPDFEGPRDIIDAAIAALNDGENQYARSMGMPQLSVAVAEHQERHYGIDLDPMREVVVTSGCTEAIAASLLGILESGDEVILFEPYYDSYPAVVAMAGAHAKFATLRAPTFELDEEALRKLFCKNTRAIVVNSPHNPSGHVFSRRELECIVRLAEEFDAVIISDEVYEHLTYDAFSHVPIATIDNAFERTITLSSTGKTFSFTGWKVGWATGPANLISAVQAAHQFLTFSGARPLQVAMATALQNHQDAFLSTLRSDYQQRRDFLYKALKACGFDPILPQGTYFILCGFSEHSDQSDIDFAKRLCQEAKVACIPPSPFYAKDKDAGRSLVRFAFCKKQKTLEDAVAALERWAHR